MKKQRQIYFFLPNFSTGGAGNSIFNVCKSINRANRSLNVISIGKNHYKKKFKDIGVRVIELKNKRSITGIIKIFLMLNNISKNKEIIFISNINYANVLSSIFLKNIINLKLILIERTPFQELEFYSNYLEFLKKKIIFYLARIFYKKADYIIGNSFNVSKYIELKLNTKVITIYPIIKTKIIKKKIYNKIINISWIGRDSEEKKLTDFLKSINLLKDEKIKINIVTNNNIKTKVENIVSKDILKKIKLYKFNQNKKFLDRIFSKTDIYVNTSIYEGFPNTIVEAIIFECLVITSNSYGGCRELIKNNNYGLLYKPNDYNQLFKCIKYAIKNFSYCKSKIKIAKRNLTKIANQNNNNYKKFFDKI